MSTRQVVATLEELEALPTESVVRDAVDWIWERGYDLGWRTTGTSGSRRSTDIVLPATVLYVGGEDA